jgi:hypothetical protein
MPDALRQVLCEELAGGFFKFLDTGVEIGSNGITGLVGHIPMLDPWAINQTGAGHGLTTEYDGLPLQYLTRVTALLAGAQSSRIFRRIILPHDFGSFPANAISLAVYANDITGPTLTFSLLQDGFADLDAVDILPPAASTYYLNQLTPTWSYLPGDELILQIDYASDEAAQTFDITDLHIDYVSARGNV